jgi:hypothetical protein
VQDGVHLIATTKNVITLKNNRIIFDHITKEFGEKRYLFIVHERLQFGEFFQEHFVALSHISTERCERFFWHISTIVQKIRAEKRRKKKEENFGSWGLLEISERI